MAAEEPFQSFFTIGLAPLRSASPRVFSTAINENSVVQFLFCLLAFLR
jgi:hypothetical protein